MTPALSPPLAAAAAAHRRRWAIRAGAALLLTFALGYLALPLWLPTEYIRLQLQSQLSLDLGTPVQIDRLRAGWLEGVVIEGLTVVDNTSRDGEAFARIGRIRCDFSPFTLLAGKRVRVLEFFDPQIWIHIDETGALRLPQFNDQQSPRLPSLNYAVNGLTCHVLTPGVSQSFRIDRLDLQLDPPSGLLHLASVTRVQRPRSDTDEPAAGRLDFDANIRIPRLKATERLNGTFEAEWTDLALNDLPVPLISHVPVEQVDGITSGRVIIRTHPDLGIDYAVTIAMDGVRIMRPDLNRPAQVPDAELSCRGRWNPNSGLVVMDELTCETPSIRLEAGSPGEPACRLEENDEHPAELHLRGTIKDWHGLRQEIPEVDHFARLAGVEIEGSAQFTLTAIRGLREDFLAVTLDANDSDCTIRGGGTEVVRAGEGVAKHLELEIHRERTTGRIRQPGFSLTLGDTTLSASGELVLPAGYGDPTGAEDATLATDRLAEILPTLAGQLHVRCNDAGKLRQLLPVLATLRELDELSGPMEFSATLEPRETCTRLHVSASLASESAARYGDRFYKRRGRPLNLRAVAEIPFTARGRIDPLNLQLRHGTGMLELASRNGSLDYQFDLRETLTGFALVAAGGRWQADLRVTAIEDLLDLMPTAASALKIGGLNFLAGGIRADLRTEFSYRPGDAVIRSNAHVIADGIALDLDRRFTKRAGERMSIDLAHSVRHASQQFETAWDATLSTSAGKLSASWTTCEADPSEPVSRFEMLAARADIYQLADCLPAIPDVAERLGLRGAGKLTVELHRLALGEWTTSTARFDATQADLADIRRIGWRKPPGVPVQGEVAWTSVPETTGSGRRTYHITKGTGRLAGATIDTVEGSITLNPDALRAFDLSHNLGTIELTGSIDFDQSFDALHPRLGEYVRAHELAGRLDWRLETSIASDSISLGGACDASGLQFKTAWNDRSPWFIEKPADYPLAASCVVSLRPPANGHPLSITLHDVAVSAAGNTISARGELPLSLNDGQAAGRTALQVAADLPRLEELRKLVPAAPVETLSGRTQVEFALASDGRSVEIDDGHIEFDDVRVGSAARPLQLTGSAQLDGTRGLNLERLQWSWGRSAGTFSGLFASQAGQYDVLLGIGGDELYIEDLLDCVDEFMAGFKTPEQQASPSPAKPGQDPVQLVMDLLRRTKANVTAHVKTAVTPLPLGMRATTDAGWQELTIDRGRIELQFGCLVDGGCVDGRVTADLTTDDPQYRLTYTADRIAPGSLVDAYLRRTFPGMTATGPLTLIDESIQKLRPAPGEPNYEVGKGELIIDGGVVSGRAAPLWMARIFPNLNLASFEFSRMHSWFDKSVDGRVQHQMIYHGAYYNVYMIGWSNPEGYFDYEVGIDFLAGLESEYWANTGQGRVPLFSKTGQVRPDGSLADETVTFVSFRRVLETLFVRNNPVVTAYHAVRKRAMANE